MAKRNRWVLKYQQIRQGKSDLVGEVLLNLLKILQFISTAKYTYKPAVVR
jgi:hypothetical protein